MISRSLTLFAAVLLALPLVAAEPIVGTCVLVIDGDTIVVEGDGLRLTVQLAEIDAPEMEQPAGPEAREALRALVHEREVVLRPTSPIQDGDVTARVLVDGRDASLEVVSKGLAWTPDTSDEKLAVATIVARGQKIGLWEEARPVPPWVWRTRTPVPPTPTPAFVARSLSDAGQVVDLKKDASGKTVIAGLPQIKRDEGEDEDEPRPASGGQIDFTCPREDPSSCMDQTFRARFGEVFEGDSHGNYSARVEDRGDGTFTAAFQGDSLGGTAYTADTSCTCEDESCSCVMRFAAVEAPTDDQE